MNIGLCPGFVAAPAEVLRREARKATAASTVRLVLIVITSSP